MTQFKVGDVVECWLGNGLLHAGRCGKVASVEGAYIRLTGAEQEAWFAYRFRLVTSAPEPVGVETETEKHTRLLNEAGWRTQPEPTKPVEPKCACGASLVTAAKPGAAKCGECAIAEDIGFDDPSPISRPPAFPDRTPAEERLRHPLETWSGRNAGRRRL